MVGFRRVLIATDFSLGATAALRRAARLPLQRGSLATIVHVAPRGPQSPPGTAREARRLLSEAARSLTTRLRGTGVTVRTSLVRGRPADGIVRAARRARAELIVVGRHGRRSFAELLLGSTAERVVRAAPCAVLVAGSGRGRYRRPLAALDHATGQAVLELVTRLVPDRRASLHAVHVCEIPYQALVYGRAPKAQMVRYRRQCIAHARTQLQRAAARAPRKAQLAVRSGDPRRGILTFARRIGADMIALGHSRRGPQHALLGGVAEAVLRAATCDVVIVRLDPT